MGKSPFGRRTVCQVRAVAGRVPVGRACTVAPKQFRTARHKRRAEEEDHARTMRPNFG